jgi:hypothetical protein
MGDLPLTLSEAQTEVVALRARVAELEAYADADRQLATKAEAKLASLRAELAMAFEVAKSQVRDYASGILNDWAKHCIILAAESVEPPAHATAALAARDRATREAAMREAAAICNASYGEGLGAAHMAILTLIGGCHD